MESEKLVDEKMSRRGFITGASGVTGIAASAARGSQECLVYCRHRRHAGRDSRRREKI